MAQSAATCPLAGYRHLRGSRAPGVLAVFTADDFADCDRYFGPAYKDQPILAIERVRYAGEPVVAVVANSEREAAAAVALLDVDMENCRP